MKEISKRFSKANTYANQTTVNRYGNPRASPLLKKKRNTLFWILKEQQLFM